MKRLKFFLFFIIFISISVYSQDVDVFKRDLNDHFNFPKIPTEMSQEEFNILSTNVRLMDAMEALVVPGLIHFKVKDNITGFSLLGARVIGYSGLYYVNSKTSNNLFDVFNQPTETSTDETKTNTFIAIGSIFLVAGSYFYDWIHGRDLLEIKQQKIRYKYSLKLSTDKIYNPTITSQLTPQFSVQFSF